METVIAGYKYRIYPNKNQRTLINKTLGCRRFVYNHFLAVRRDEWQSNHKSIGYVQTSAMLTDLKRRPEFVWLNEADSMALQEALKDLETSYKNFFEKRARYPRFKSKHAHAKSFRTRNQNNGIRIEGARIRLPKIGAVKAKLSRPFDGRILHATVTRIAADKYFVSLCVEVAATDINVRSVPARAEGIGLDVGIKDFCVDSNGVHVEGPRPLKKLARKLVRAQRRLSRKMKKSNNRQKARIRLARIHEKITNIRRDFLHKLSTKVVIENQVIAVEKLRTKNMVKNHHLASAILDAGWAEFFRMLEYKTYWYGAVFIAVDPAYTSQTCSVCGEINKAVKNLGIRAWGCPVCGAPHDRDENAAKNILERALGRGA